jgi:surfactin synthase thioesterase subunit
VHTSAGCDLKVFAGGQFFLIHHQAEINGLIREQLSA